MKRFFQITIIFIILLSIVLGFLWTMRSKIVASIISKQLNAPVKIEQIDFTPEQIEVRGLSIESNDALFPRAFSLEYLRISASLTDLVLHSVKKIEEIYVRDLFVGVHLYNVLGTKSNWSSIIGAMQGGKKPSEDKETEDELQFVIGDIYVDGATMHLKRVGNPVQKFAPLNLHIKNIGSDKPASLSQVTALVIGEVMKQLALKHALPQLFENLLPIPQDFINKFGDTLKNFPKRLPFFRQESDDEELQINPT